MSIWKYTNVIKARKLDAEQEKPSLPSCAVLSSWESDSPDVSSDSVGWGCQSHCGHRLSCGLGWAGVCVDRCAMFTGPALLSASFLCVPGASAVHT